MIVTRLWHWIVYGPIRREQERARWEADRRRTLVLLTDAVAALQQAKTADVPPPDVLDSLSDGLLELALVYREAGE